MATTDRSSTRWPDKSFGAGVCLALAVVCALAGFAERAAAETPQNYDIWRLGSMSDVPFASEHTTRRHRADGTFRYTYESRSLVDLLGQRQEHRDKFDCVVSPLLAPVSFKFESHGHAGKATAEGHVEGRELVIRFLRGDSQFERRIPVTGRVVFSPCLTDALAAFGDSREPVSFDVVDISTWQVGHVKATRMDDSDGLARWQLKGDVAKGTWWLSPDGMLQHAELSRSFVVRRSTAVEAGRLKYLKHENRDLLVFPLEQDLPFPERLRSITVRLQWKDTPREKLEIEDSRQRIVRQSQEGGQHEVELRLGQPAKVDAPVDLPVSDPSQAQYLAKTHYIRPNDPAIRQQARQWTDGSTTTLAAVEKLSREIWNYLDGGSLVVETLSGPEVLACRKGKCTEFTTLLASLARSIGVPTRVALGMRLSGGRWMGHMWCEVWVGQWIPVDASADEVGGSPALLKLTHSPTVQGTQEARWAMAKSLGIKVIDVQHDPDLRSHLKTGIVRQSYTNADFACRITAPASDWMLEDKSKPGVVTIRFEPPEDT